MKIMTSRIKSYTIGDPQLMITQEWERIKAAGLSYNAFHDYYSQNKIFFPEETCLLLDLLKSEFWDARDDYEYMTQWEDQGSSFRTELLQKTHKQVYEEVPKILRSLEFDLRNVIYVGKEDEMINNRG
jgi:hypothetical protein